MQEVSKKTLDTSIEILRWDFPDKELLTINVLSDIHIGSPLCDEKMLQRVIGYIKETGNLVLINGDIVECVTRTSKGDIYQLKYTSPDQQVDVALEYLKPIKDQILGVVSGNHDKRSDGHDYGKEIAYILGVPFNPVSILHVVRVGSKSYNKKPFVYTLYQTHGYGGGRTAGAKSNMMERFGRTILADVVVVSHLHTSQVITTSYHLPDLRNLNVIEKSQFIVLTPSFLNYGGYARKHGYPPPAQCMNEITFYGTESPYGPKRQYRGRIEIKTCEL